MDRIRAFFAPAPKVNEEYEPLVDDDRPVDRGSGADALDVYPFSWLEYGVFAVVGVAMLWAWNMFLAAAPYFQKRFEHDEWILEHFQSSITSVSTITNLTALLIFTNIQSSASYPMRISTALIMNIGIFSLMTLSTSVFVDVSATTYLVFVLVMVCSSAWATGLLQNGAFAFVASFGRAEYVQAIMVGQGVAGILPPLVQIVSVLAVPDSRGHAPSSDGQPMAVAHPPSGASASAFIYFLTAVAISAAAFAAFLPLVRWHKRGDRPSVASVEETERTGRDFVGMTILFKKLHWLAASVFMCFSVTMFFPVFTDKITSVRTGDDGSTSRLFTPGAFIPLGYFFWALGDLCGRVILLWPPLALLQDRPAGLFVFSLARVVFLPAYMLCNIRGRGALVDSDLFYLLAVQFPFGLTNGWLGASSMMASGKWVAEKEREAAGSFMSVFFVAGLTAGSLLSFAAAGI